MKINYLIAFLFIAFVSIVIVANIDDITLIGGTELNGNGCVCHTIERDTSVNVWVEGPDTLLVGQTGYYRMYMTGGPAEAGGYNVAGRFGEMQLVDSFSVKHSLAPNELTQAFSLPFPTTQDTIYWAFGYTASDSSAAWDTIYSCGLSLVWDSIPDPFDRWNFGHKFPVKIETLTDVDDNIIVEKFQLFQNYPNPFNPKTILRFRIGDYGYASLKVYDVIGNEVAILVDKELAAGEHEIVF
ncbi:MAG: hypothetical protein KJN64_07425, partial [Ignavibacteria bacterium]|nr:hypothetical protein [Ignavibacteria bacterium]